MAPHPPIMIPEVGGGMTERVTASIEAMKEFARRLIESGAETVVIVSPHAPLDAKAFVAYSAPHLRGEFSNFHAPQVQLDFLTDRELLDSIHDTSVTSGIRLHSLSESTVDHGVSVPLYFLQREGWDGAVVALGYSFLPIEDHLRFGQAVLLAAEAKNRSIAFIASGDLSHRLNPDAPAGFHPDAHLFDEEVIHYLNEGFPEGILKIDSSLRQLAGECGYRSLVVALGVIRGHELKCEVISYEAPFGVGYMVGQLL